MKKSSSTIKELLKQFSSKKARDYGSLALFFIIFSTFIIFAIRPSLTTALTLAQKQKDLVKLDSEYESIVSSVVSNQAQLENVRDQLYLLADAMPNSPQINTLIKDIENEGQADSVAVNNVNIGEINLIQKSKNTLQPLLINVQLTCTFDNLIKFIQGVSNQRRLKTIKQLSISKDLTSSSQSAQLKVTMQLEGYSL